MKRLILLCLVAAVAFATVVATRPETSPSPPPISPTTSAARPPSSASVQPSPTPTQAAPASTPAAAGVADVHGEQLATALPTPAPAGWDQAARDSALHAATAALEAYGNPGPDQAAWWGELAPWLSPTGQWAYQTVDSRLVPALALTGDPTLADTRSPLLAKVVISTDKGEYDVTLTRADGASPWLVERLEPTAR